jgi:hypothetical protein
MEPKGRSQWPHGRSPAEIVGSDPTGACMFVCFECCVLSGKGLCDELITRPEESYRLWCVVVCDLENLKNEEAMTCVGSQCHKKWNLSLLCVYALLSKLEAASLRICVVPVCIATLVVSVINYFD